MNQCIDYLYAVDFPTGVLIVFLQNLIALLGTVLGGALLVWLFRRRRLASPPPPITRLEIGLSIACVMLNTVVATAGLILWQQGFILIFRDSDWVRWSLDLLVLFMTMDLLMYLFHRVAHVRWVYVWAHQTHHRFENPRPLTLYALNPIEVLGFGGLWLGLLCLYSPTWIGMLGYLVLNQIFGTCGHLGVEPLPRWITRVPFLRHLSTSTFHHQHHEDREHNFGFYTTIWDRLFGTLAPNYADRIAAAGQLESNGNRSQ